MLRDLLQKKALQFGTENEVFLKSEWPGIKTTMAWALGKKGFINSKKIKVGPRVPDKECWGEGWLAMV